MLKVMLDFLLGVVMWGQKIWDSCGDQRGCHCVVLCQKDKRPLSPEEIRQVIIRKYAGRVFLRETEEAKRFIFTDNGEMLELTLPEARDLVLGRACYIGFEPKEVAKEAVDYTQVMFDAGTCWIPDKDLETLEAFAAQPH